jgi:hypothetical protein
MVPISLLRLEGVNCKVIWQLGRDTLPVHVFDPTEKSGLSKVMGVPVKVTGPFISVTTMGPLVELLWSCTLPKLRLVGAGVAEDAAGIPVPVMGTDCGLPVALSV